MKGRYLGHNDQINKGVFMINGVACNGVQDQVRPEQDVSLKTLSEMTGFPVEFIKKELLLDGEEINMETLRESMLRYLEQSMFES